MKKVLHSLQIWGIHNPYLETNYGARILADNPIAPAYYLQIARYVQYATYRVQATQAIHNITRIPWSIQSTINQSQEKREIATTPGQDLDLLHKACANPDCTDSVPFNSMDWSLEDVRKVIYRFPVSSDTSYKLLSSWTMDEARIEAINQAQKEINPSFFSPVDPHLFEHQQVLRGAVKNTIGRIISRLPGISGYQVLYPNNGIDYYYLEDGTLFRVDFFPDSVSSSKVTSYSYAIGDYLSVLDYKSGELIKIWISESGYTYQFSPSGAFLGKTYEEPKVNRRSSRSTHATKFPTKQISSNYSKFSRLPVKTQMTGNLPSDAEVLDEQWSTTSQGQHEDGMYIPAE